MLTKHTVYLDHSATTPTDPRVVEAMLPYFSTIYGNTASSHTFGRRAEDAIESARETIAQVINASTSEIIFTSGGSESDNLALRGMLSKHSKDDVVPHFITTPVEHTAILKTADQLHNVLGIDYSLLPVDSLGKINPLDFSAIRRSSTRLVSVMLVNNEVGTIQPVADIARLAKQTSVRVHSDVVQAVGQLPLNVDDLGVDMLSMSAHKFYGPKGVGLLYVRKGIDLTAAQTGGSHEDNRRAGTLNTPAIVGMAVALDLAYQERETRIHHFTTLRDQLIGGVLSRISDVQLTGDPVNRLPSNASFLFSGLDGNLLVNHLDMRGIAASSASACKTGNPEPSSVLLAMGYAPKDALGSLRLTVGLQTSPQDIDYTVEVLADVVARLRKMNREMAL